MTTGFPQSAHDFYALRDDRTNRVVSSRQYQDVLCELRVSCADAVNPGTQAMVLVAANILSRWCRRVLLNIPPDVRVVRMFNLGSGNLGEIVLEQMRDADPFGRFSLNQDTSSKAPIVLHIGEHAIPVVGAQNIFITESGWLGAVSKEEPLSLPADGNPNWLGAVAAASFGVSNVFKIALGIPSERHIRDGIFDVFSLEWVDAPRQHPWPTTLNIGNVLLVGAGSVGSSAAFCMRLNQLGGFLTILDGDLVKIENFNRSPIFGRKAFGRNKAEVIEEFLSGSPLSATAVPSWWNQFVRERSRLSYDFDIWLSLANEFGVRSAMQNGIPPLMIHASTTANWGVNHGRHIPGRDDCLLDRFPSEVSAEELTCATGGTTTSFGQIDAALPFASIFAGLLVTADLVRSLLADYPQVPNFALFDWFGPMDVIQAWDRQPRQDCACRNTSRRLQEQFNSKTRAYPLFRLGND